MPDETTAHLMDHPTSIINRTFSSLSIRNYRLWVIGQGISLSGTWMQTVAMGLLVLHITGSGTVLGLVVALQTLPVLLFGPWGGVIADRFPKRTIMYVTQALSAVLALTLGALVGTGAIRIEMVYALAIALGVVTAVDNPTRQAFVLEMVGPEELVNAVSLNSTQINLARVIGPTLAGALIATVGMATCFIVNGLSFLAVIVVLAVMRADELRPMPAARGAAGQLRQGFRYVRSSPLISTVLVMMAIIGTFTYEFSVSLPMFAQITFEKGASAYAAMTAAMGLGAVIGGLYTASRPRGEPRQLTVMALLFGLTVLVSALAPTLPLAIVALVAVGFCSIGFTALGNSTIQLASRSDMRGRVMSLWTVAFLGSTPIGGPIIGWIGEHGGPRWALALGGAAAIAAAAYGAMVFNRSGASLEAKEIPVDPAGASRPG
ncbi:MAG: MFS transporter [Thermomicrobiales bacterium]